MCKAGSTICAMAFNDKRNDLAEKLAQRYKDATEKGAAALKELRDAHKGLYQRVRDAIAEVIEVLRQFKTRIMAMLKEGQDTIMLIVSDPIGFLANLLAAIAKGVRQFVNHIWDHLKQGFMAWLFGSLAETGIAIPKDFSLGSLLMLVLSVLGLTYDRLRAKAVKLIGERAVSLIEHVVGLIKELIANPGHFWETIKEHLSNLKETIFDAIKSYLETTIIQAAVTKLLTMFNPVGAIIQAIITIYNTVMFFIERINQILAFVEAIIASVHNIAIGAIDSAANWIEQALARTIPLIIAFLARMLGITGITEKIQGVIKKLQATVDQAVDKVIEKIVNLAKKLGRFIVQAGVPEDPNERLRLGKQAALAAVNRFAGRPAGDAVLNPLLAGIKARYGFARLEVVPRQGRWHVVGAINPDFDEATEALTPESLVPPEGGRTLLVGEGNFSFALNIAVKTKIGERLVATDYVVDERLTLAKTEKEQRRDAVVEANVRQLREHGVEVERQVDARDPSSYPQGSFDIIVFNHPLVLTRTEGRTIRGGRAPTANSSRNSSSRRRRKSSRVDK